MIYMEERPWGYFKILYEAPECKVKEICVYPGNKLSYQSHEKRTELWQITKGSGIFIQDDVETFVNEGMICYIPEKSKHRIINDTDTILKFVEIQTGTYFGEDDIFRYEDDYGRSNG